MKKEEKLKSLEKNFRLEYRKESASSIIYIDEKLQRALESLVVSKKNLRERIWYAYKYYFSDFLWGFDYKKYLSETGQFYWEFLQKELQYKIGPEIKEYVLCMLKHNSQDDILKYLEHDRYGDCPNFIRNLRTKDLEIARAMFNIIDEIHGISYVRK